MTATRAATPSQTAAETLGTVSVTRLENGFTIVSETIPQLQTVALGVWVHAGARHETKRENGLSHLLEHMAFKGTTRRTAREIAEAIEEVGGDLNAMTASEYTAYYVRVLKDDLATAVDVLADIVLEPAFDEEELAREKDVIIQEIASYQDSPDDLIYDLAQDASFPDQALGRAIIGTPESVTGITVDDLQSYRRRYYTAAGMVLSAAGNVDHDALVAEARKWFAVLPASSAPDVQPPRFVGGSRGLARPFEQAHLLMAFESVPFGHPDYFAAQVFSGLFGGGMSSRLFQEIRERLGLCYSIYSSAWGLADTGLFLIHAATGDDTVSELADVLIAEFDTVVAGAIEEREVQRSKAQIKAGLMMSLESTTARAEQMARQFMVYGRILPPSELVARIDKVTANEVLEYARGLRRKSNLVTAVIGAGDRSEALAAEIAGRYLVIGGSA